MMANIEKISLSLLRDWKFRRRQREQAIAGLRRSWDAGIASGPATDGHEAFARIQDRISAKLSGREARQ